jgi:hypothetical protein
MQRSEAWRGSGGWATTATTITLAAAGLRVGAGRSHRALAILR